MRYAFILRTAILALFILAMGAMSGVTCSGKAQARPRVGRPAAAATTGAVRVPATLRGSPEALEREARMAHRFRMPRFADADALRSAIARGDLVRVHAGGPVEFHEDVGEMDPRNRELYLHAQPQVRAFLIDLVTDRDRPRDARIVITSMARTLAYQRALTRKYANAVRDDKSSHPTGATVDISAKGMPPRVRAWLRAKLARLEANGLVQATEETGRGGTRRKPGSSCFHVMVSPAYLKYRP